jgi:fatty-acyl-CoA synthase
VRLYAPVIVLRPGQTLDAKALEDWCRERMAGFKRPRGYRFVSESELPRTATGKIQHRVLKERIASASVADSR